MNNIDLAKKIRVESLEMVSRVNASHIGAALSMVEILVALYGDNGCNVKAKNPSFIGRDRIILSRGMAV